MKSRGYKRPTSGYKPIHMPRPTATGIIQGGLSLVLGFAMVWYMWWLAALAFVALIGTAIGHTFNYNRDYFIPVDDVERQEGERTRLLPAEA